MCIHVTFILCIRISIVFVNLAFGCAEWMNNYQVLTFAKKQWAIKIEQSKNMQGIRAVAVHRHYSHSRYRHSKQIIMPREEQTHKNTNTFEDG